MQTFIDYAAIKAAYSFEEAVRFLGLAVEKSGDQFRGPCPVCKTGGPRGLAITPGKGFYCFGAKKGGDVISLIAHIKGIGQKDAALLIQELLVPAVPEQSTSTRKRSKAKSTATKRLGRPQLIQTDQARPDNVVELKPNAKRRPRADAVTERDYDPTDYTDLL
jgi:DNA primase